MPSIDNPKKCLQEKFLEMDASVMNLQDGAEQTRWSGTDNMKEGTKGSYLQKCFPRLLDHHSLSLAA